MPRIILSLTARIVIAGADAGYSAEATRLIDELGVDARIIVDYFDISDFVAVLSAATVVVAPYQRASSSGVLSIANRIGTPSVAYPVGGLVESATFLTEAPDPRSLAVTLDRVLELNHEQLRPSSEKWSESTWVTDLYAEATITGGKS